MEAQNEILTKIKNETKQQLQLQILPLLSQLVDNKIKEESDKFFEKTNILGDIFPKRTNGFCSNCHLCNLNSEYYKQSGYDSETYDKWKKECIQINSCKISEHCKLYDDEYIILCSRRYEGNNKQTFYYTNYGRLCFIQYNGNKIWIYTRDRGGSHHMMYGSDGCCGRNPGVISEYFDKKVLLSNEYIDILNTVDLMTYCSSGHYFNTHLFNKLIHIYKKYNPKASEIYRIEKQKEEIKKMTSDLQKRETELVQNEKKLYEKQNEFEEEKKQFEEEKKIHKQKSKNLLKRENSVFLKESIKSIHQELSDISYSLSDVIDLLEDVDPLIEQRLTQTIQKLTLIFNNDNVIHAIPL